MFTEHFGLKQNPFSLANDSSFSCIHPTEEKTCEEVLFDLQNGFNPILLIGKPSSEKNQLLDYITSHLPENVQYITPIDGSLNYSARVLMSIDQVIESGHIDKKLLLIIDNADDIPDADFKLLILLPKKTKALQMIWFGSTGLVNRLNNIDPKKYVNYPCCYYLDNLDENQVRSYINFRLEQSGYSIKDRGDLFNYTAIRKIARLSRGNPRAINALCNASLTLVSRDNKNKIGDAVIDEAVTFCLAPSNKIKKVSKPVFVQEDVIPVVDTVLKESIPVPRKITIRIQYKTQPEALIQAKQTGHNILRKIFHRQNNHQQPITQLLSGHRQKLYAAGLAASLLFTGVMGFQFYKKQMVATSSLPALAAVQHQIDVADTTLKISNSTEPHKVDTTIAVVRNEAPTIETPINNKLQPSDNVSKTIDVAAVQSKIMPSNTHLVSIASVNKLQPHAVQSVQKTDHKQVLMAQIKPIKLFPKEEKLRHDVVKTSTVTVAHTKEPEHKSFSKAKLDIKVATVVPSKTWQLEKQQHTANVSRPVALAKHHDQQVPKHKDARAILQAKLQMPSPILDAQERATRDRAANRLSLSRLGVDFNGDSLVKAAQKGDLPVVKLLINGGVPHNIKNNQGQTALTASAKSGHKQIVDELLKLERSRVSSKHNQAELTTLSHASQN